MIIVVIIVNWTQHFWHFHFFACSSKSNSCLCFPFPRSWFDLVSLLCHINLLIFFLLFFVVFPHSCLWIFFALWVETVALTICHSHEIHISWLIWFDKFFSFNIDIEHKTIICFLDFFITTLWFLFVAFFWWVTVNKSFLGSFFL